MRASYFRVHKMSDLQSHLKSLVTLIKISSYTEPALYYSNASYTLQDNGVYFDVIPLIVEQLKFETVSVLPFANNALTTAKKPVGFKLGYTVEVLYEIPKYYGAIVEVFIGQTPITNLNDFLKLYSGHISNVSVDDSGVSVTLTDRSLYLKNDLLETYHSDTVPILIGRSTKCGTRVANVLNHRYHILSSQHATIHSVKDANGVVVPYTLIPFRGWTVIDPNEPVDSFLVVDAENGTGTLADLCLFIATLFGYDLEPSDVATLSLTFPEEVGLQLHNQMSLDDLISYILRATSSMWYIDQFTGKIRIIPFYYSTPVHTYTDKEIIYTNAGFSYKTRPYTSFQIHYELDYARHTHETVTTTTPASNWLPEFLKRDFGEVYTLTNSVTEANKYLQFLVTQYSSGLGVVRLKVNISEYFPVIGETVKLDSDMMKLRGNFIIEGILYDLNDLTYTLTLTTI